MNKLLCKITDGKYLKFDATDGRLLPQRSVAGFVSIFDRENKLAADFASLMERNQGCNLDGNAGVTASPLPALLLVLFAVLAVLAPRA